MNPKPTLCNRVSFQANLTASQARKIFKLALEGKLPQYEIARMFRTSQSTVSNILRRKVYRRVTAQL